MRPSVRFSSPNWLSERHLGDEKQLAGAPRSGTTGSAAVAGVGRPVRLEEVPLLGGPADQTFQFAGDLLGDAGDVVAQAAGSFDRDGRADDTEMAVGLVEVDGDGQDRR